jgi:hypothetical protein
MITTIYTVRIASCLPKALPVPMYAWDALQAQMDPLKRLQPETAAELDALLPAILDRAFKGELRNQQTLDRKG